MSRFEVDTGGLRNVASTLRSAADAAERVVAHPGVVRGHAQDGGDEGLRDEAARFAERWEHGLRLMSAHSRRTADSLTLAADTYEQAEAATAAAWSRTGRRWVP